MGLDLAHASRDVKPHDAFCDLRIRGQVLATQRVRATIDFDAGMLR